MLLQSMIKKIENDFPEVDFSVNEKDHVISISSKHPGVEGIDIQVD